MARHEDRSSETTPPPIYIVSGGVGASGEGLVLTALAQFPENPVPVITIGNVRHAEQIDEVIDRVKSSGGTIAHTLVDASLRKLLIDRAREQDIFAIDLMGTLLFRVAEILGKEPLGQPGLYRRLHKDYFDRVSAIEFTMAHDDGKDAQNLSSAEIILAGVSRTGKTPLSLYLSVLGWKVANVPLVLGVNTPPELFQLNPRRVIGLTIEPGQLLQYRKQRQLHLGVSGPSAYTDPTRIFEEVQYSLEVFRQGGFTIVDVTDKPIEASADEIIRLITHRF